MHPNKESNRNSSSYIDLNNELSPFIEKLNKHKNEISNIMEKGQTWTI